MSSPEEEEKKEEEQIKEEEKPEILIFNPENIDEIYNSLDPLEVVSKLLESHHRKKYLNPNFDPEKIIAKAEFHVNNLLFLKDKFPNYDNITFSGILNAFSKLIDFDIYKRPENNNNNNNNNNEKIEKNENEEEEEEEEINEEPIIVNFLELSKEKLNEFKNSLINYKIFPRTKGEFALSNYKNKRRTSDGKFFLNLNEAQELIKYIRLDFFPYIRMWFYLEVDTRKIKEEKIELCVNEPIESLPLSFAIEDKSVEKEKEQELSEEEKKKLEEEELKRKEEEEKKKLEEEELKKKEEEEKKEEKEETYLDLLERLGFNEETKKIIIEKIEELHKDVDDKIEGRQKTLEEKVNEIEETVKGKKK